jgi:hypothetical protein
MDAKFSEHMRPELSMDEQDDYDAWLEYQEARSPSLDGLFDDGHLDEDEVEDEYSDDDWLI